MTIPENGVGETFDAANPADVEAERQKTLEGLEALKNGTPDYGLGGESTGERLEDWVQDNSSLDAG